MNNNTTSYLIKEYIKETLNDEKGVSSKSYELIKSIMQEDRNLALDLHNIIEGVECSEDRYYLKKFNLEIEYDIDHGHEL